MNELDNNTLFPTDEGREELSLSQYNRLIVNAVNGNPALHNRWVVGETSDVSLKRHCYLELIEKDDRGNTVARLSAVIWASAFTTLNRKFKESTGQDFVTGLKVRVRITANYHEQFGIKGVITDIDPVYTMGDLERLRREILQRLQREGIADRNKQLPWPTTVQRVAVISAAGAAGYGDFVKQLMGNAQGIQFYPCLFAATMQGSQTSPTVIAALRRITAHREHFDVVVIIRGGGSTSDLNSFDTYELAREIALMPLPVVTGIGHERDTTVLDAVASRFVKTPTAAAELLILRCNEALTHLTDAVTTIATSVRETLSRAREQQSYYSTMITSSATNAIAQQRLRLQHYTENLPLAWRTRHAAEVTNLDHITQLVVQNVKQQLEREHLRFDAMSDKLRLLSPRNILNRGFSLTVCNGRYITSAAQLHEGDVVVTHFGQGRVRATVNSVINPPNNQQNSNG